MNGKGRTVVPVKWKIAVTVLVLLCIGLLIALIVVAVDFSQYKEKYPSDTEGNTCAEGILNEDELPKTQGIFNDLTSEEIIAARDFMLKQSSLKLKSIENASVKDNYIYMIQLHPPEKEAVLNYLEEDKAKPARKALVVIFEGEGSPPFVQEYIVTLPNNSGDITYEKRSGSPITFNTRPYDQVQRKALDMIVLEATTKAFRLLNESYDGFCYHNCTNKLLKFHPQGPFGKTRDERTTWLQFTRDLEGESLHPVDFQLYIDFPGSDVSKWKVSKVYYNGQTFNTVDDLLFQYNKKNTILKSFIPAPKTPLFSSYDPSGIPQSQKARRSPRMFEPDGKRFSVSGRHIKYMQWSFDFRMDSVSGPQLFDIRFKDERIVYELSLQEAISFYSGFSPYFMAADFVYGGWAMGAKTFELVGGVDCPETSEFFDVVHFVDTAQPKAIKNALCVFEMDSGIPLRRHFETNGTGYKFYEGLASRVLVLRTIITVRNYDNIFDFVFYQSGAIEVKSTPTGYVQSENDRQELDDLFGHEIHTKLLGNLNDHIFHYKVDLDVDGRLNSFEKIEVAIQDTPNDWLPPERKNLKILRPQKVPLETDSAEVKKIDFDKPTFYNIYSDNKNKFESKRGYLIQPLSAVKQLLPEGDLITKMAPWSVYPLVVTRYKENELRSSSLYNQNSPTQPVVNFESFFQDINDNIEDEDLVAWVSIGCIEIPSSEDVPNVASAANTARFFLQPFNYFDAGTSTDSSNAVFIKQDEDKNNVVQSSIFSDEEVCVPRKYDINLKGSYK